MPIKHTFVSAIADDAVPAGKVQPSHWNGDHDLSALTLSDLPRALRPTHTGLLAAPGSGSPSSSASATKAVLVRPSADVDVDTVNFFFTASALTDRYQVSIHEATATVSAGLVQTVTVGALLATSAAVAPRYVTSYDRGVAEFSTPVPLTAGTLYLVCITRTDATPTTAALVALIVHSASLAPPVLLGPGETLNGTLRYSTNVAPAPGAALAIAPSAGATVAVLSGRYR